jgi:hypothetical protein
MGVRMTPIRDATVPVTAETPRQASRDHSVEDDHEALPRNLPRWIQIPAGIFLFAWASLALVGSVVLVIAPPERNPPLAILVGMVLVLGSIWVLLVSWRLIIGSERRTGGLLSPLALRVTGVIIGVIPVIALFTGAFWDRWGALRVLQALGHLVMMAALFRLASRRASVSPTENAP